MKHINKNKFAAVLVCMMLVIEMMGIVLHPVSSQAKEVFYEGEVITDTDNARTSGKIVELAKMKHASADRITLGKEVTTVIGGWEDFYQDTDDQDVYKDFSSIVKGFPKLKEIRVEDGNSKLKSVKGILYTNGGKQLTVCPPGKTGAVAIPKGTKKIDTRSFMDCKKITSVSIPASVETIDEAAFGNNTALKKITVSKNNKKFVSVDGVLFSKDKKILYAYPAGKKKSTYKIPKGVKRIADTAFIGNRNLKKVTFSSTVTKVCHSAFENSKKLTTVITNKKLKTLAAGSFRNCKKLKSIKLKNGLKEICEESFIGDKSIKSITFPSKAELRDDVGVKILRKAKVTCYTGSFAESYCKRHKIPIYKVIGL